MVERMTPRGAAGGAYEPAFAETHSGLIFFAGDRAYKLKKDVDLGFLDFTSREKRLAACRREVALNRRLSPDVYLGVADIMDASGEPCEHLVVMRRMPADRRLSTLALGGAPVEEALDDLARLIARFHATALRSPEADGTAGRDALAGRWAANTAGLERFAGRFVDAGSIEAVDALAARYLTGRKPLLEARIAAGRARDGHGDLLADDIFLLDDGPRVLDCLEFDDALRLDDVLADVAFLAMDLERLGRPALADRFLAAYRTASGDTWPASLAHHHIAYRAQVRAKVSAIRADQGVPNSAEDARTLLHLALDHLRAGRVRLVLVGGLPGTGKSTLARGIGEVTDALVLRSDVVRKELSGLAPDQPAGAGYQRGIYTGDATVAVYAELLRRAEHALGGGEVVVLDASWTDDAHRADARRVANETASDLIELRCVAPAAVAAARLTDRAAAGGDASDADSAIATAMAATADPWPTSIPLDTVADPDAVLQTALAHVGPT
jgi:aminoglycoside phosphotransferase family enzyme/predicted kinase